jgi:hypothetical protein
MFLKSFQIQATLQYHRHLNATYYYTPWLTHITVSLCVVEVQELVLQVITHIILRIFYHSRRKISWSDASSFKKLCEMKARITR